MQIAGIAVFRLLPNADARLAMAVLVSSLLHALMLTSLAGFSLPGDVFSWPVQVPLSVQIEARPIAMASRGGKATRPVMLGDKKVLWREELAAARTTTPPAAADIPPHFPLQPGVTVTGTQYLVSIPASVTGSLMLDENFRKESELGEQPEAVAIRIPKYPQGAQEQKSSGWVIVMLFVDEKGRVVDAAAVTSSESFVEYEQSVAHDLRGSVFTPGTLDGRAVKSRVFAKVLFDSRVLVDPAMAAASPIADEN